MTQSNYYNLNIPLITLPFTGYLKGTGTVLAPFTHTNFSDLVPIKSHKRTNLVRLEGLISLSRVNEQK